LVTRSRDLWDFEKELDPFVLHSCIGLYVKCWGAGVQWELAGPSNSWGPVPSPPPLCYVILGKFCL
jgi:hypothetical protein